MVGGAKWRVGGVVESQAGLLAFKNSVGPRMRQWRTPSAAQKDDLPSLVGVSVC